MILVSGKEQAQLRLTVMYAMTTMDGCLNSRIHGLRMDEVRFFVGGLLDRAS
jgi:hypothetical protein